MAFWKRWKKRLKRARNRLALRFFETRMGRELLVGSLPDRVIDMTTDCGDHILTFSPHDYIGRKVYRKGHFEREGVKRLRTVLDEAGIRLDGRVLLELGGNIGTQTIYWARENLFRLIVSVEADPRNFALLSRNITQNGLSDTVKTVQVAAGETEGMIDFFQNPDNHGKSSALRSSPRDRHLQVPVTPVPAILAGLGIDPGDIGLVWMDIEGYEPVACRSMETLMAAGTPLYMEFSPAFYGDGAEAFRTRLARHYGRAFVFREDRPVEKMAPADLPLGFGQYDVLLLP